MAIEIGMNENEEVVEVRDPQWSIHTIGNPGTGKSFFLGGLCEQAADQGDGVLVLDLKDGHLAKTIASRTKYPERVVYVAPGLSPKGMTWGINPLHGNPTLVVDNVLEMFDRTGVFVETMTQVKQYLTMGLWLALEDDAPTLKTVLDILVRPEERRRLIRQAIEQDTLDPDIIYFWTDFEAQNRGDQNNNRVQRDAVASTAVRLREFLIGDPVGACLKHPQNTFLLQEWLDAGKIVICDLVSSREGTPHRQSRRLGNVIMAMFVNAAAARMDVGPDDRSWRLLADEFDQLASETFVHSIDKLRAAKVIPVLAHQNFEQIGNRRLNASLSSQPAKVYFRIAAADRASIIHRFGQEEARVLMNLPNYHARLLQPPANEDTGIRHVVAYLHKKKDPMVENQGVTVRITPHLGEVVDGQLSRVIANSHRYLVTRHDSIEGYDYGFPDDDTADDEGGFFLDDEAGEEVTPGPRRPQGGAGGQGVALAGDPGRGGYIAGLEQAPLPHQSPDSGSAVPGDDKQSQEDLQRSGGEGRRRPVVEAPVRVEADREDDGLPDQPDQGQGDGQDHRKHRPGTGQHSDQGGDQDSAGNARGKIRPR